MKALLILLAIVAATAYGAASLYRSQHCIYLFGHWIQIDQAFSIPLVCQVVAFQPPAPPVIRRPANTGAGSMQFNEKFR